MRTKKNLGHSRVSQKKIWHSRECVQKKKFLAQQGRISAHKKIKAQQGKPKKMTQQGKCTNKKGHSRVSAQKNKGTVG